MHTRAAGHLTVGLPIMAGVVLSGVGAFIALRNVRLASAPRPQDDTTRAPLAGEPARESRRVRLNELDDGQLAQQHVVGDSRAFGVLVDRYQIRLLRFVHRTIGDRDRAEELVQEVFIRVFRHLHRFDRTKTFATWIYRIASDVVRNDPASRRSKPMTETDTTLRLADVVGQCVGQLPESVRQVFVLRELEGMGDGEIAEITGCTVGVVRSRLGRARHSFAEVVAPLVRRHEPDAGPQSERRDGHEVH